MKTKSILFSLVFLLSLVSCKKESDKATEGDKNNTELKETFDVSFNLVIPKDDTFQLYFTEDGTLNFGDDRSIKSVVKGNGMAQDVLFKLPADVLPTNIRLDFGDSAEQGSVIVNSMKIKYLDGKLEKTFVGANKEEMTHYFYLLDTQIKYDPSTSTVSMLNPAGQLHDPLMWSNQLLSEEMVKLYKK